MTREHEVALDFSKLPPVESVDPQTCHFCMQPKNFVYTTEMHVCSDCLGRIPVEVAISARRGKMMVPDTFDGGPDDIFRAIRNTQDFGSIRHSESLERLLSGSPVKKPIPPKDAAYKSDRPDSYSTYAWSPGQRVPGFGDNPREVHDYIVQNYSADDVAYNYSEIKDELLYPRKSIPGEVIVEPGQTLTFTVAGTADSEVKFPKLPSVHDCELKHDYIRHQWYCPEANCGIVVTDEALAAFRAKHGRSGLGPTKEVRKWAALRALVKAQGGNLNLTDRKDSATLKETTEEKEEAVSTVFSREAIDAMYKRAAEADGVLNALEQKYSPDLPDGSVVAFHLTFGAGRTYSYAAIRAIGQWFPTGKIAGNQSVGDGLPWSDLLGAFESFGCKDFEVLRTGGDVKELVNVDDIPHRSVVIAGTMDILDVEDGETEAQIRAYGDIDDDNDEDSNDD
jgi:hypothetical protein